MTNHTKMRRLAHVVTEHALAPDDAPPNLEHRSLCAAQLHALATVAVVEQLESIATLLATGLGRGSPIFEAIERLHATGGC